MERKNPPRRSVDPFRGDGKHSADAAIVNVSASVRPLEFAPRSGPKRGRGAAFPHSIRRVTDLWPTPIADRLGSSWAACDPYATPGSHLPPWRGPTPRAWLAWIVILLSVAVIVWAGHQSSAVPEPRDPLAGDALMEIQARLLYAGASLGGRAAPLVPDGDHAAVITTPGLAWRLAAYDAAATRDPMRTERVFLPLIESFDDEVAAIGGEAQRLHESVKAALVDPESLDAADAALVEHRLGWFGLALLSHRSGSADPVRTRVDAQAKRAMWITLSAVGLAGLALLAGITIFILLGVRSLRGEPLRLVAPAPHIHPAIFLEAVAVYLALYLVLSVAGGAIIVLTGGSHPILVGAIMLAAASFAGALWPMLRSRAPATAAADLGLTRGRGVLREIGAGLFGYLACVPIMAVGMIATIVLLVVYMMLAQALGWEAQETSTAPHPILEWVAGGSTAARLGVLLLAAGVAPLFEEIMFRGALFSGASKRLGVGPAMLIMAFIFAVIHPQGWLAVPALMSIAVSFALLRMWRGGCLIAPITAHALHNGAIVGVLLLLFT